MREQGLAGLDTQLQELFGEGGTGDEGACWDGGRHGAESARPRCRPPAVLPGEGAAIGVPEIVSAGQVRCA
ncbi:hypothetical protein GCM10017776_01260 [Streptomyces griseoluteus]|nr:hypothetical protein GCM10017776_01260 [Streptomyces griseoluteus]